MQPPKKGLPILPEGAGELPASFNEALRLMMDRPFCQSERFRNQQWRANQEGAHPKILEFADAMVRRMCKLGVPMFPHCIIRTRGEQNAAYALGHSQISGNKPYAHQFAAVDLIHGTKAWELPERCWDLVGHVGNEVARQLGIHITWGGDWDGDGIKTDQKLYDPAHWELTGWRNLEPVAPFLSKLGRTPTPTQ